MSTPTPHRNISKPNEDEADGFAAGGRGAHDNVSVVTASAGHGGVWGPAVPSSFKTRRQDADTTGKQANPTSPRLRRTGWISRVFMSPCTVIVFGVLLVWLTTGCVRFEGPTGEKFTMIATDAAGMVVKSPSGWELSAVEVNQSRSVQHVGRTITGWATISALKAVSLAQETTKRALSSDSTSEVINASDNATREAINASDNALKEAELLSGQ